MFAFNCENHLKGVRDNDKQLVSTLEEMCGLLKENLYPRSVSRYLDYLEFWNTLLEEVLSLKIFTSTENHTRYGFNKNKNTTSISC